MYIDTHIYTHMNLNFYMDICICILFFTVKFTLYKNRELLEVEVDRQGGTIYADMWERLG